MRRLALVLAVVALGCAEGTPPSGETEQEGHSQDQGQGAPATPPVMPATRPAATSEAAGTAAAEAARRSYEAMGGDGGFARAAAIRFGFVVHRGDKEVIRREHLWDRVQGRNRVTGRDRKGRAYAATVDLEDKTGWAVVGGQRVEGPELAKWLDRAYASWVNDSYWLLMPAKLLDPGVVLEDEGETTVDGQSYRKLELTFEEVGLTPGDTYWAFLNPETGLMDRWEYVLQGREPPATDWTWESWQQHGPLRLAGERRRPDGSARIEFDPLEVLEEVPTDAFAPP